jgi:signal transduction histidine kinase
VKESVLIVDDNLLLAENVAELLRDEGAVTLVADTPELAEAHARELGFDLAIVDIRLAGDVSGLDLVPRLRRHSVHGEVVLMTGEATLDSAIQAIRRGVYAYITKPFDSEQLVALARRALAQGALKRDRAALARRLEASEALHRSVVESVEACIVGLDAQGFVRFTNRLAAERLGGDAGVVGRHFGSLCEPLAARDVARAVSRALAGDVVRDLECRFHGASARPRTIRWTLTPLERSHVDVHGAAAHGTDPLPVVVAAGVDITDRLELERKMAEAEAMAAMGVLTAGLAHEIRNPLNAAKLQLELLVRRARRVAEADTQIAEPAALIKTEIERLSTLLDEFLQLARPRPIERRRCSLAELFSGVLALEKPVAAAAGIELHTESPGDLAVEADPDKLKQVLLNLVGNAVDALRERGRGRVVLSAEPRPEGGVSIAVSDDGPGVPSEVAETAFTPFVTSKPAGTGLGLAIVQKIVAQHGGWAELVARPEGGTIAQFHLPG